MNVALIFPPLFANLNQPHSAMPYIASVLKARGHSTHLIDLNLAFVQWLLEGDGWNSVQPIIDREWERLNNSQRLEVLSQRDYMDLVWLANRPPEGAKNEFLKAVHTLKDPVAGYIWEEYDGATRIISRLWTGLAYWSTLVGMDGSREETVGAIPISDSSGTYYGRRNVMSPQVLLRRLERISNNPSYDFFVNTLTEYVERQKIELLGFSVTTLSQLEPTLGTARALHNRYGDDLKIVFGGNIITRLRPVFAANPDLLKGIYAGIIYEGEIPILQLAAKEERKNIQNLIYTDGGRSYENPVGAPMNIDQIPAPDFSDLDLGAYLVPDPILPVVPGHGCDWKKCAFCNITLGYSKTQHRSSELVVGDMTTLHELYGTRLFTLYQESISPERLTEISRIVHERGADFRWEASAELEPGFSQEVCELMYKSGCRCLHFGLESIDSRIIRLMGRNINPDLADEILHNTAHAGIMNAITLISGFPTETKEEAQLTAGFLEQRADVMHSVSVSVYYISKGSPVDLNPQHYGVSFRRDSVQPFQMAVMDYDCSSGMTASERNAHALELSRTMQAHGCVLPVDPPLRFTAHYETNKPSVIFEKSKLVAKQYENNHEDDALQTRGPKLRPGVTLSELSFPLDQMRNHFVHPLSGTDTLSQHVERSKGFFCLDSARDRVIRLSEAAFIFLSLCDGRPEEELIEAFAERENISWERAEAQQRGLLRLYRAFLR